MTTRGYDVAHWMMTHLPSPSDTSQPLRLTDGQVDFLAEWYRLDRDRFAYRRGALQQAKGWGKSPLAALIAIAELAGPVRPTGEAWDSPLVQVIALSEEQADSNVFSLIFELLRANDRRAAIALGIDEGRGRLYLRGRPGKLEPVTSSAGAREGQRVSFAVLDETHLWTKQNGGLATARTARRNTAKVGGRTLECANAPELGRGSVAELTLDDAASGRPGVLLVAQRPSRQPEPSMADAELAGILAELYVDAPWVDTGRLLAEVRDPSTPWDEAFRYFFNLPGGGASVLVEPAAWARLVRPGDIPDGTRLALGFDGSHAVDGTALVACTEDGLLSLELLIERAASDPPGWSVPRQLVHDTLADLFGRFEVVALYCDPWHWRDEIAEWAARYGEQVVVEYPTNSIRRFGPAVDRFRAALAEGRVHHEGDADLTRHLLNARLLRGRMGAADDGHALYTLEKPGAGRLIDAAVAAVLAYEAMQTAPPAEPVRETLFAWA